LKEVLSYIRTKWNTNSSFTCSSTILFL